MIYKWNIIGHEKELAHLEEDLKSNNLHHAYLFVGPAKIGKGRVAKCLARILQCPNDFCGACAHCIQIEKKCHPDTIEIEDDGESIKIETVREIIARLAMTGQSRHKILLIHNIGRLTPEAANCLLKTLEEPTPGTIFIFTANRLRDILPTIASRMRIAHFKALPDELLQKALERRYPEADASAIREVILLSMGRSGRAIQLMDDPVAFREIHELYANVKFFAEKAGIATRLTAMQEIAKEPGKTENFLALLTHYLRDSLLNSASVAERKRALAVIDKIHMAFKHIEHNVSPRFLLENIMLSL